MKFRFILIFSLVWTLVSCVTTVTSEPQPINVSGEKTIPTKLQGVYMDTGLIQAKFTLYESYIHIEAEQLKYIDKKDLDSTKYFFTSNKLYETELDDEYPMSMGFDFTVLEDSISYQYRQEKKVFINSDFILKKVGTDYLLSKKGEKGWWEPFLIRQSKSGNLSVNFMDSDSLSRFNNYSTINKVDNALGAINYIDAQWKKKELELMIQQELFPRPISTLIKQ